MMDKRVVMRGTVTDGGAGWAARALDGGRWLLDLLLPPRCLGCGHPVDEQGRLCAECWSALAFLGGRLCRVCGVPMPEVSAEAPLCGCCQDAPPAFERARAALQYEGSGRRLILRFKHGDRLDGAATYAGWMARAGAELLAGAELIVPVPLHRWRLVGRGYNQSAVLARALGRRSGKPVLVDALVKSRATESQQLLGAAERRRNITADLFGLGGAAPDRVAGRRILLVDDVLTTGSTGDACAAALLRSGAAGVDVLTLARVVQRGLAQRGQGGAAASNAYI